MGSLPLGIPGLAWVAQKCQFSKNSDFEISNLSSSEVVHNTKNILGTKRLLLVWSLFYVLTFWKNINKQLTYSLFSCFYVFVNSKKWSTKILMKTILKWFFRPNNVFRSKNFLGPPPGPISVLPGLKMLKNQQRRPLVKKLY